MMLLTIQSTYAQQSKGLPVLFQNFGKTMGVEITAAPALPAGRTGFNYSGNVCPIEGAYTIVRGVKSTECFNNEWIALSSDFTSDYDTSMSNGNMMLVNHGPHSQPLLVYTDTIKTPLCTGADYTFSFAAINVDKEVLCSGPTLFPVLAFNVETASGLVLFTDTTRGGIPYADPVLRKFSVYKLKFKAPALNSKLIIRINVLPSSADCGEDFAIDDILVSADGPDVNVNFNNEPASNLLKSVCFQDSKTITLDGVMQGYYISPALQWQQSTDDGVTWVDIIGATNTQYTQTFSQPDTFLFRLTGAEALNITNPGCRVTSRILKVEVDGLPKNYRTFSNSPVCSGSQMQLTAEGGASYEWSGPNSFYDNVARPHIFFSSLRDSGMYYVDILSLGGCRVKDSTYVTIIGTDVSAGVDTSICKGIPLKLNASEGVSYSWLPVNSLNNSSIKNPVATPEVTTTYIVKVTDRFGCSDTAHLTVMVKNKVAVKAGIHVNPYLCRSVDSLQFFDNSSGNIKKWYWDFGNGQTSISKEESIQYYTVPSNLFQLTAMLAVEDDFGCADTAYQTLYVINNCYIAVPNAFTPNGDGLNDNLKPLNAYKATELTFRVFNINGKQIYETNDFRKGWDGTVKGVAQNEGVYAWTLEFTDVSGKKIRQKGTTILIR